MVDYAQSAKPEDGVEKLYRLSCKFCKYHLITQKSLVEWAKTVIEKHCSHRHSKETEKLYGSTPSKKKEEKKSDEVDELDKGRDNIPSDIGC